MRQARRTVPPWLATAAGVGVAIGFAAFATDAVRHGTATREGVRAVVLHLLPSLVVLGLVLAGRRWPRAAGTTFLALAIAYAVTARTHPSWLLVIALPLLAIGVLTLGTARARH